MPRLSSQERFWKERLNNPASTDAEKAKAAQEVEKIKRRHERSKRTSRKKARADDPKPGWYPLDGNSPAEYQKYLADLAAWEKRNPDGEEPEPAPKKIAEPTPTPVVFVEPAEPAPVKIAPRPVPRPAPVSVVRAPREGWSGQFFVEAFWSKPLYERNAILRTLDPGQQAEWNMIVEKTTIPQTIAPLRYTEEQKAAAFTAPMVTAPATGQVQTVDQIRETYGPTIGDSTASGITPELDRRGWMPNIPAKELTPSR
jgi:hypothetical protein